MAQGPMLFLLFNAAAPLEHGHLGGHPRFRVRFGFCLLGCLLGLHVCHQERAPLLCRLSLRRLQREFDAVHLGGVPRLENRELLLRRHPFHAPLLRFQSQLFDPLLPGLLHGHELLDGGLNRGVEPRRHVQHLVYELEAHAGQSNAVAAQVLLHGDLVPAVVLGEDHHLVVQQEVLEKRDAPVVVDVHIVQLRPALRRRARLAFFLQEVRRLDVVHGLQAQGGAVPRVLAHLEELLEQGGHVFPIVLEREDEGLEEELALRVRVAAVDRVELRVRLVAPPRGGHHLLSRELGLR
mmetsp:Transcript_41257/g.70178  ORF Transcript_41257/g.70178 Transcript_41257/m.70178 type:complete len:294 (-) Transcript_41257:70-951(-)